MSLFGVGYAIPNSYILISNPISNLTLFRMGLFGVSHEWWGPKRSHFPKNSHACPTMIKLDTVIPCLKEIKKIYIARDTSC